MHPILNGYIARQIIAQRQAEGEAWRRAHHRPPHFAGQPDSDAVPRRSRSLLRRLSNFYS